MSLTFILRRRSARVKMSVRDTKIIRNRPCPTIVFRPRPTIVFRSGPLILKNVSHFWPSDPWFRRMFHNFGHPTFDFEECFTLLAIRPLKCRSSSLKLESQISKFEIRISNSKFQIWNSNPNSNFKFEIQIQIQIWNSNSNFKFRIWNLNFGPRALSTKSGFLVRAR